MYICKKCGSDDLEVMAWVKLNKPDHPFTAYSDGKNGILDGEAYCCGCDTHSFDYELEHRDTMVEKQNKKNS